MRALSERCRDILVELRCDAHTMLRFLSGGEWMDANTLLVVVGTTTSTSSRSAVKRLGL